ncbi:hypothetical protein [Lentilactobacillus sp. SPB1-3]|uniref:Uncharacterized protein n=1 Tax=Lentilactobacillus terminaliae TaxID=3003483 RepID=A0ACD5DCP7_9LACO
MKKHWKSILILLSFTLIITPLLTACGTYSTKNAQGYEIATVNSINGQIFADDNLHDPNGHKFAYYYDQNIDKNNVYITRDGQWYRYNLHSNKKITKPFQGNIPNKQELLKNRILLSDNSRNDFIIQGNVKKLMNMLKQK